MTPVDPPKSTAGMMTDILAHVSNLVRNEVDLARAEVVGSLKKAVAALVLMAVALVLTITGLNLLAAALVGYLAVAGISPPLATILVGGGLVLVALIIFLSARATLKNTDFMPARTARNVRRDAAAIKDPNHDQ